jgi:hypothetical protein
MHWLKEASDLKIGSTIKKKSSVKSYLQSLVRVSLDSNQHSTLPPLASEDLSTEDKATPTPSAKNSKVSFDYDKIFRRLSSLNSEQPLTSEPLLETFPTQSNLFTPLFVSSVLFSLPSSSSSSRSSNQSFANGMIQLFPSGTLIVNYEQLVESQDSHDPFIQKASQSFSCQKVLCSKYEPSEEEDLTLRELSRVALSLRIFSPVFSGEDSPSNSQGGRRPTPATAPSSKSSKKGFFQNNLNGSTELIL